MKSRFFIILGAALIASGTFIPAVRAATMSVVVGPSPVTVGKPFRVDVSLDTEGDDANAIQGTISFPADQFSFAGVNDGDSPVSLWIAPPHMVSSGTVEFSGIVPGGFIGSASSVVGVILVPSMSGPGDIKIQDAKLLRNDGEGSAIALTTVDQAVLVAPSTTLLAVAPEISLSDPQNFMPVIAKNPNIYGGKYFLVFSTTDKGSGIGHYEIAEVPAGSTIGQNQVWVVATSPYLLKDQTLSSDIYVRAVNNAGGITVAKVPARFPPSGLSNVASWIFTLLIFFLLIFLIFLVMRAKRRKPIDPAA